MDVTIYEDVNFGGRSETLEVGSHWLYVSDDMNDVVSSIKVPTGLVAMVFENADTAGGFGRSADLLEDCGDLSTLGLGDMISFVEVFAPVRDIAVRNHGTGTSGTSHVVWVRGALASGQYVAGHWEHERATPPPVGPVVVSPGPLPHLLHISKINGSDWENPVFDTSGADWSSQLVGGKTFDGGDGNPYEWVSVLNPTLEQDDEVGIAGFALSPDISQHDLPFTHPFGSDYEYGLLPDPAYAGLLAPANRVVTSPDPQDPGAAPYSEQFPEARRLGMPTDGSGFLGLEVEAGIVPAAYQAASGDRVAVYGRWIVDDGHPDFHTEIHPPLLMARARPVNAQDADTYPDGSAVTLMQLWGRPYQAAQKFTDGDDTNLSLQTYLQNIATTLSDIRAYPPLFAKPFDGIHLVSFVVRPPVPTPPRARSAIFGAAYLECSYSFTVNQSCGLQVQQSVSDPNAVEVILALNSVGCPVLPDPPNQLKKYKIDDLVAQINADLGTVSTALIDVVEAYQSKFGLGEADIYVREYDPLPTPDVTTHAVPYAALADLPRSSVNVDNTQPFPVIGWVKVRWAYAPSSVVLGNVGTVQVQPIQATPAQPRRPRLGADVGAGPMHLMRAEAAPGSG